MPVHYERDGYLAYLTIDRPEKGNSLDAEMVGQLEDHVRELGSDPKVRVGIVIGAGDKSFCTGVDIGTGIPSVSGKTPVDPAIRRLITLKGVDLYKPMIACVNGHCLGGGLELLTGTDIRLACPEASFGLPEVSWGITARGGGTVRLPRQIPWAVAMEMLLTGDRIDAERAFQVGLVNRVVPRSELRTAAEEIAGRICANGPIAVRAAKESAIRTSGTPLSQAYEIDFRLAADAYESEDAAEGPAAFREGRDPDFKGC